MRKKFLFILAIFCIVAGTAGMVHATYITSYDIVNAVNSGFGSWSHEYSGTITDIESIDVSGYAGTLSDYSGGAGTLNDGIIGTNNSDTQLFATDYHPEITLYLDNYYTLDNMTLYSFTGANVIPGNITSVDLTIGGITETFLTSTSMGMDHEFIDIVLGSSGLSDIATKQVILSGFKTDGSNSYPFMFSISEIDMTANPAAPVPEPTTIVLLGTGLLGLAGASRKKLKSYSSETIPTGDAS